MARNSKRQSEKEADTGSVEGSERVKKINLIKRAERLQEESRKMPLMGYPRKGQEEIIRVSVAIIKAICDQENTTPFIAKYALKMAAKIIKDEMQYDAIL